jgi:hypothetical protein
MQDVASNRPQVTGTVHPNSLPAVDRGAATSPQSMPNQDVDTGAAGASPDVADRRTARIAEYLAHSLDYADPLQANVGAVNADLLLMADRLRQLLEAAPWASLEDFDDLKPAIDSLLRIHKQIDRFAQLETRLGANADAAPQAAAGSPAGPVRQAVVRSATSEEIAS